MSEGFDHPNARDVFFHDTVEIAQIGLHLAEGFTAVLGYPDGDSQHDRQQGRCP